MINNVAFIGFIGCIVERFAFKPIEKADIKYEITHKEKNQIDGSTTMID